MAELPPQLEKQLKEAYGVTEIGPIVNFVDWAIPDDEATKASGRPRFKDCVFIEKRSRGGHVRDVFRCRMEPQHKREFPREWAEYEARKGELANRAPPIAALPGMSRAIYEELLALEITDCGQLAGFDGDLDVLEPFRDIAKQIMEISHAQNRAPRAQRESNRATLERPVYSVGTRHGASGITPDRGFAGTADRGFAGTPAQEKARPQESQEENVTFTYRFNVA